MHLLLLHGCRIGAVLGANVEDLQGAPGAHRLVLTTKGGDVHELPLSASTSLLAQLRGEPAPKERWNPTDHGQRETGRLES